MKETKMKKLMIRRKKKEEDNENDGELDGNHRKKTRSASCTVYIFPVVLRLLYR